MQKLKLYVTETNLERRELTPDERHIVDHTYGWRRYFACEKGYVPNSLKDNVAEFETTTEREATNDEFRAWLDYKKECIRIGVEHFRPMRDELKDKEFRIEVVEE